MNARKLIIDCDPGIDDSLALMLAAASKELDLVGITTVSGNVPASMGAKNALKILSMIGKPDVPVYVGEETHLVRDYVDAMDTHGMDGLGESGWPDAEGLTPNKDAVSFLIETLKATPDVTILALGPMTNLAKVISRAPECLTNLTALVGFHMGVEGAAISTLISRIFCAVVVLWKLRDESKPIFVKQYLSIQPDFGLIKKILFIGIPSGIENSMFQFGKLAIQSTVSTLGTVAIAAQAMTNILENLNGVAAIGVGIGLMTVVGQCLGAGRKDEAIYYIKKLCWLSEVVIVASCLLVFVLTKPITMIGGMEAESAKLCMQMMIFITIVKPLCWVMAFVPGYGMRAAGDVKFSMITSCCTMWLCRVSLCIYLCRVWGFGPIAVWIGMAADWSLRSILFTIRFKSGKWLNHHLIEEKKRES